MAVFPRTTFRTCNKMIDLKHRLLLEQGLRKKLHFVVARPPFHVELNLLAVTPRKGQGVLKKM